MPVNVEWKARAPMLATSLARARALGEPLASLERQVDVYFHAPSGRLKLRRRWIPRGEGTLAPTEPGSLPAITFDRSLPPELIAYHRPDGDAPRPCRYRRLFLPEDTRVDDVLRLAVGAEAEVEKRRAVFVVDGVRIHLDDVTRLGTFLEFEAIVDEACDEEAARAKIRRLQEHFSLGPKDAVPRSYRELVRDAS